ncbi:hypothetical protein BpHYR1_020220 [Brachionus plicatilis]|uniref:Uncharacterized protein n=1 Tax=Brachionus plicatilis TaxID=10195 RepID=A0A3M7RHU0_BRAPC|nr:hypothetical protein BpHYR1_020220 [Brachionus plicatilis]
MFRYWQCLVGYNNGPTYGQVLKAYFSGKSKKTDTNLTNFFIFEILSLKEQQLFKSLIRKIFNIRLWIRSRSGPATSLSLFKKLIKYRRH